MRRPQPCSISFEKSLLKGVRHVSIISTNLSGPGVREGKKRDSGANWGKPQRRRSWCRRGGEKGSFAVLSASDTHQFVQRDRQIAHAFAGGVVDGVCDRRRGSGPLAWASPR